MQEGRRSLEAMVSRFRTPERNKELWIEYNDHAERKVRLACGEESQVITSAREALVRLAKLKEREMGSWELQVLLLLQRQALNDAAQAAVKLRRFAEAETAARSLLSLPLVIGQYPERLCLDQPDDPVWARVLLAEALAGQGRPAEGLKTLQSAVAYYRDTQVQGATHVSFYQRFARALYVQALAEPLDNGGETRRRDSLKQATALLQNLTDEARQLHDSKELLTWIVAAQKKLGQEPPQP